MKPKHKRIYYHKRLEKYQVMAWYGGKNLHIGYRKTLEEAIELRNQKFKELGISLKDVETEVDEKIDDVYNEDEKLLGIKPDEVNLDFI